MRRDAFDRLRDADPLRGHDVPSADDPAARALRDSVMAGEVRSLDATRRRRRWVAAGVAAAALATAAALAVSTSRVEDPTQVGCYAAASTRADTVVVGVGDDGAVATCATLWAEGVIDPAVRGENQVPVLVPCVLDAGQVGVFPTGSCDDVTDAPVEDQATDLPTSTTPPVGPTTGPTGGTVDPPADGLPLPDYGTDDERVRRAMETIRVALFGRCLDLDAAVQVAEDALAAEGLEGWTIGSVVDDHPDGTCTGFFPDVEERAVRFVPEDPEPGQTPTGPTG